MKIMGVILCILFLSACSTTKEMRKGTASDKVAAADSKVEKQDVKSLDLTYSDGVESSFSKRGKYKCDEYKTFKKEDWKKIIESGFSCIVDKNWAELSEIADILSHNHLKAPWGPFYKSVIASDQRGDHLRALWMVDLALRKSPENTLILFQKARVKWLLEEHAEAFKIISDVVKKDKKNYEAAFFLSQIHYRDREFKEALKYFKDLGRYYSKDSNYRISYAESLFHTGKFKESVQQYKVAAGIEKNNATFYYRIGQAYKNMQNWSYAKSYLEKAISQRRKGRALASLSDEKIRKDLKFVEAKLVEVKGGEKDVKKL